VIGEDIQLDVQLGEAGYVSVDPGQLGQVLMNLVVNARDAMPRGGRISLRTSREEVPLEGSLAGSSYARLDVADTGQGMKDEVKKHIFEPFFTTKKNGTGLGLATVYGIVKQCGGEIRVETECGRGSTFTVLLPTATAPANEANQPAAPVEVRGGQTILVVEDEEIVRRIVVKRLRAVGYAVIEARNGEEAVDVAESALHVDLILSDVVMPGINGTEVAERVRQRFPEAAVLFMSGYPENIITHHGVLVRGIDYLEKADLSKRLIPKVHELLSRPSAPRVLR
jgi:CheY-like chemotaxis protein